MNLAFLHRRYDYTGGTERDLYELVGQLLRLGHDVHLYCGEYRVAPQEGAVIHHVPYLRLSETAKLLSFASLAPRAATSNKHDLIISFSKVFRQDIARCGGGTHRQYLRAMNQVRSPSKKIMKLPKDLAALFVERKQFLRENCRRIIAVSKIVKKELVELYEVPEKAIDVVYDGVDIKRFCPENRQRYRSSVRKTYNINENETLLLFVGSGYTRKGLEFLLRAMADLRKPDVKLLVVGHDSNIGKFQSLTGRLGISDSAIFAGLQKEVERYYAAADVVALPSVQEAFGNVVLEALASGLPVITTHSAGASEILEGDLSEFVLNRHDDIAEMARMLQQLSNPDLRMSLSAAARRTAEQYSFERNARAVERIFEAALKEKLSAGMK